MQNDITVVKYRCWQQSLLKRLNMFMQNAHCLHVDRPSSSDVTALRSDPLFHCRPEFTRGISAGICELWVVVIDRQLPLNVGCSACLRFKLTHLLVCLTTSEKSARLMMYIGITSSDGARIPVDSLHRYLLLTMLLQHWITLTFWHRINFRTCVVLPCPNQKPGCPVLL